MKVLLGLESSKGQTTIMKQKLFTYLIDALGKVIDELKVINNLPKAEKYKLIVEVRKELYYPRTKTDQTES